MNDLGSNISGFLEAIISVFLGGNNFKILGVLIIWYIIIPVVMGLVFSLIKRKK